MKALSYHLLGSLSLLLCISCAKKKEISEYTAVSYENSSYTQPIREYYFNTLDSASFYIQKLDTLASLDENKRNFLKSREWYKRVEPLLIAYDYQNYLSLNAPNLLKVELDDYTEIKKMKPKSYQVLEELLFGNDKINNKELHRIYSFMKSRIPYLRKNHNLIRQYDYHHLTMVRDAIVNVATKGITGFDSPMLANSLQEAAYNYETLLKVIKIYKPKFTDKGLYDKWISSLQKTINELKKGAFDSFDRYNFIKNNTDYQLALVKETSEDWNIELNTSRALDPNATRVFSKDFFNINAFKSPNSPEITPERVALGKALFNDTKLSKNNAISCATCHIATKAFTDGKTIATGVDGGILTRNTPTLPYAVYQKSFFYDGRSAVLEDQIVSVTNSKKEFHIDLETIVEKVEGTPFYVEQFNELYKGNVTSLNVRNAIATYIRSLTPFDSKFDRNMQNLENTLSVQEKKGFNLFMGKAACATCHFPPTFYGTVPPKFDETEFENLGLTKTDDFKAPILDDDPGLFYPYEVEERRGFFKTATVRNIEITAPYMHNGAYKTLEKVLEFYNAGGGSGMGLEVPFQTLPSDSLNLSQNETSSIIAFLKTLTDKQYENTITP